MKRLFISQPMCGKTDREIITTREKAVQEVQNRLGQDIEVIESFFKIAPKDMNTALWCLGRSIKLMATADVVYFAEGWEQYRGCRIENICAKEYGLTVIEN